VKLAALALAVVLLPGCATTARSRGESALAVGDYAGAINEFRAALADHPDNLEALQGLGVAQYRTGAFADAGATFGEVLARVPHGRAALLYGALADLQRGEDGAAEERLTRLRALEPDPRFGAQVDRAMRVLRTGQPAGAELRAFIAASLEDSARAAGEVRAARLEAERAYYYWRDPLPYRCYPSRRGGLLCF